MKIITWIETHRDKVRKQARGELCAVCGADTSLISQVCGPCYENMAEKEAARHKTGKTTIVGPTTEVCELCNRTEVDGPCYDCYRVGGDLGTKVREHVNVHLGENPAYWIDSPDCTMDACYCKPWQRQPFLIQEEDLG